MLVRTHQFGCWVRAAVAGAGLVLAGCQSAPSYVAGTTASCPQIAFLGGTERVVKFRPGAGQTAADIAARADMMRLGSSCELKPDSARAHLIFDVEVTRIPGPRATLEFPYFIAVTDAEGTVLAKHQFSARIAFADNVGAGASKEQIQELIPLAAGQRSGLIQIYVGFQLTDDELNYNLAGNR